MSDACVSSDMFMFHIFVYVYMYVILCMCMYVGHVCVFERVWVDLSVCEFEVVIMYMLMCL